MSDETPAADAVRAAVGWSHYARPYSQVPTLPNYLADRFRVYERHLARLHADLLAAYRQVDHWRDRAERPTIWCACGDSIEPDDGAVCGNCAAPTTCRCGLPLRAGSACLYCRDQRPAVRRNALPERPYVTFDPDGWVRPPPPCYPAATSKGAQPQGEHMNVMGIVVLAMSGLSTALKIALMEVSGGEVKTILTGLQGAVAGALEALTEHSAEAKVAVKPAEKVEGGAHAKADVDDDAAPEADGPGEDTGGDAADPD